MHMKRFLLLIIAVNLLVAASAHKYLQEGLSWQNLYENGRYLVPETLHSDTIVNGKEYLHYQGLLLRDDSIGLYFYSQRCDSDYLLFQYGAEVGDSILIYNSQYPTPSSLIDFCDSDDIGYWEGVYAIVSSVDTIRLLNGEYRRRVYYGKKWYIEGIGGFRGIKGENYDSEGYFPEMLCCYIGDTLLWARNDCEQWQSKYPNACLGYTPLKTADTWYGLIYKVPGMFASEQFEDIHYILTSDTTIGEHTYRKLIQNDTICVGGLRQTEDGMKVYYYDMVSPSNYPFSHVDCLLYDFTANVGDTIKNVYFREEDIYTDAYHGVDFGGSVVLKKDTIDGRIHMKVGHCDIDGNGPYYVTTWIQGIGTRNVIWPDLYGLPGKGWINEVFTLCALHGDEELYTFSLPDYFRIENNCTEWHFTGLNDIPADNSRNRKFLRNGHIYIETPLGTFDATGRKAE